MKESSINAGTTLLTEHNRHKNDIKLLKYEAADKFFNELEEKVLGLINETWCFWDREKPTPTAIKSKFAYIKKTHKEVFDFIHCHKSKFSKDMWEILAKIDVELFHEEESVESLFFMKTDKLDNLEEQFIQQLKIDIKRIEKGKSL